MKIPISNSSEASSNLHQVNDDQNGETGNGSTNGSHNDDVRQRERHEEAMFAAVDRFCNSSEQTYDEFLTCFSYFRPGPEEQHHNQLTLDTENAPSEPCQQQVLQRSRTVAESQISARHCDSNYDDEDDVLEEEVLTGSLSPESDDSNEPQPRPMIKVDNFVDDEDVTGDSEYDAVIDGCQPYVASFAYAKPGILENDEQSKTVSGSEPEVVEARAADVGKDGQADEESIQMPSVTTADQLSDACHSSTDVGTDIKYDSGGELIGQVDRTISDTSHLETDDNICNDVDQDISYPGEITEDGSTIITRTLEEVTHIRQMEYSAKMADTESDFVTAEELKEEHNRDTEPVSDEVQPFSLDEDFDYDNVILTPKYSQYELNQLKLAMDKVNM